MNRNLNRVCFKSSYVVSLIFVIVVAMVFVIHHSSRMNSQRSIVTIAPVSPVPAQPSTSTIIVADTERRPDYRWPPLAPRGRYGYYSRPVLEPVQVGLLTGYDDGPTPAPSQGAQILPLYFRPCPNRNNRYQYFTRTDTNNPQDIPVFFNRKNCMDELGCDEIFDGETVHVPALRGYHFRASLYPR